jgi:hypothetical protein
MAGDKLSLGAFVQQVADEWAAAVETVEAKHPTWQIGQAEIVARVAFRVEGGKPTLDFDEPERFLSELRIPLRRKE